jgi:hypothetical protein
LAGAVRFSPRTLLALSERHGVCSQPLYRGAAILRCIRQSIRLVGPHRRTHMRRRSRVKSNTR